MKTNKKGVSLIVLVITIIVMIILASAVIISLSNTNIIDNADKASQSYKDKQSQIIDDLKYSEYFLSGDIWKQQGTKVTRGDLTLEVGDYVYYDSGVDGTVAEGGWRVLGADKGYLLVVSTTKVDTLTLTGIDGYLNGVKKLNQICAKYANKDYAKEARSIMVEDINRVTGYNPNVYRRDIAIETGKYGNTVSYKMNAEGTYVTFKGPAGSWITADGTDERAENSTFTSFQKLDGTYLKGDEVVTVTSTYYGYNLRTLTEHSSDEIIGWTEGSKVYSTLSPTMGLYYWLADQAVYARFGDVCYSIRAVRTRKDTGRQITSLNMWVASQGPKGEGESAYTSDVRAVVYIDLDMAVVDEGKFNDIQAWGLEKAT